MLPFFLLPSKKQSRLLVNNTAPRLFLFSYFLEKHILKKRYNIYNRNTLGEIFFIFSTEQVRTVGKVLSHDNEISFIFEMKNLH